MQLEQQPKRGRKKLPENAGVSPIKAHKKGARSPQKKQSISDEELRSVHGCKALSVVLDRRVVREHFDTQIQVRGCRERRCSVDLHMLDLSVDRDKEENIAEVDVSQGSISR